MKMLLLVYSSTADEFIIERIKRAGIVHYTKFNDTQGEGLENDPRLANRIWPGKNSVLFSVVDEQFIPKTMETIREMKNENPRAGIRCFTIPVEDVL
ncbi:MAG: hypothetical protein K9K75_05400 [Deltaproteobacteria bacterium]|nr:hypothetical protein [Deltaproteobacteria bacterium]